MLWCMYCAWVGHVTWCVASVGMIYSSVRVTVLVTVRWRKHVRYFAYCDKSGLLEPTSHLEIGKLVIHRDKKLGLAGQTNL